MSFLPPDYGKTAIQIYCEAAKACMLQDKNMWILYSAASPTRLPGLPSWVPDWSQHLKIFGEPPGTNVQHFQPTSTSRSWCSFAGDNQHLIIRCKFIDTLKTCANSVDGALDHYFAKACWTRRPQSAAEFDVRLQIEVKKWCELKAWIERTKRCTSPMGNVAVMEMLAQTLLQGLSANELAPAPLEPYRQAATVIDLLGSIMISQSDEAAALGRELTNRLGEPAQKLAEYASTLLPDDIKTFFASRGKEQVGRLYNCFLFAKARGRRLFTTGAGRIGTAPDLTREGDAVALVSGFKMPLVLRHYSASTFHLVTHAYVHGIMQGEAWPEGASELIENTLSEVLPENGFGLVEITLV